MNRLKEEQIGKNSQQKSEVDIEKQKLLEESTDPDYVEEMVERADRKAQYMAAAEVVLTQELYRYYRNTQRFSQKEIKKQVENALQETDADWEDDIQNFSPAVILKKYGKSNL